MEDLVETIGELSNSAWQVPCILVERRGAAQVSRSSRSSFANVSEPERVTSESFRCLRSWMGGLPNPFAARWRSWEARGTRAWFLSDKKIQVLPFLQTKVMSWEFSGHSSERSLRTASSAILGLLILGLVVWLGSLLWTPSVGFW